LPAQARLEDSPVHVRVIVRPVRDQDGHLADTLRCTSPVGREVHLRAEKQERIRKVRLTPRIRRGTHGRLKGRGVVVLVHREDDPGVLVEVHESHANCVLAYAEARYDAVDKAEHRAPAVTVVVVDTARPVQYEYKVGLLVAN